VNETAGREAPSRSEGGLERHRLEDLLAQAPAGIGLLSGPDHRWTYVNEQYVRVTGRNSASDFVGKTLRESLPEIEAQGFFELLDKVYRTGESYTGREVKATLNRAPAVAPENV
jgi:PAS domain-containing protein